VDVNLPGASGIELCRRIRATPALSDIPVAVFSSWHCGSDMAVAPEAGADFILSKELLGDPEQWRQRVGEILGDADGRAPAISLSFSGEPAPPFGSGDWLEAVALALHHPLVRRLEWEFLRVLVDRAARLTRITRPPTEGPACSTAGGPWFLTEDGTFDRNCLSPSCSPETVREFAFVLARLLGKALGSDVGALFRDALQDALSRPAAPVSMKPIHAILLVEDNLADVKITQRALQESCTLAELIVVRDGQAALDYLQRSADAPGVAWRQPDLILLDLNLPRLSGREVVERIRAAPELKAVPVVVLTTSRRREDVQQLYAAGANTYIEKPQDFRRFVEVLRTIQHYWLETALLPSTGNE
jgi:chemotaxis family two-component system response regulator Rcp1